MTNDLMKARDILDTGGYTCVVCKDDTVFTATERGVKPLLDWVNVQQNLSGFSAADRVVGRATAYLYVLLGVKEIYAGVMSRPASLVLQAHGIGAYPGILVDGIINRKGTGPCPFEAAVMDITDPQQALETIRQKAAAL